MNKPTTIYVCDGYWHDGNDPFCQMVISNGTWDGIEDAKDEAIFFYTEGKPIIGDHGDFVVTSAAVYDYLGDV